MSNLRRGEQAVGVFGYTKCRCGHSKAVHLIGDRRDGDGCYGLELTAAGAGHARSILRDTEAVRRLSGDFADHVEILIEMQHGEARELAGGRYEQIRNRWCAVLAAISEQHLHLQGAVFDCRREVFDRHRRQRRSAESAAGVRSATR